MAKLDSEVLDVVFAQPADQFIATRNALAKQLAQRGETDAAHAVRTLRKPTAIAAAVNELARTRPDEMSALIEAGKKLRKAQEEDPSQLRTAMAAEQRAVEALVTFADARAGWSASTKLGIRATLRAGAHASGEVSERLGRGWLEEELRATGFEALTTAAAATAPTPTRTDEAPRPSDERAAEEAKERAAEHQRQMTQLERQMALASADAAEKEKTASAAEQEALRAREEAQKAKDAVRQAQQQLEQFRRRAH